MSRTKLNIGLFGFGCVGNGLYEILQKTPGFQANIKNMNLVTKKIVMPKDIGIHGDLLGGKG